MNTQDKCNVCGWTGDSNDVIYNQVTLSYHCPRCGSQDTDDIDEDPYEDEDEEDGWLFI